MSSTATSSFVKLRADQKSEGILKRKLNMPLGRIRCCNLPKICIGDQPVGLAVAGNIEEVEEVAAEVNVMILDQPKRLLNRHIDLLIARRPQ